MMAYPLRSFCQIISTTHDVVIQIVCGCQILFCLLQSINVAVLCMRSRLGKYRNLQYRRHLAVYMNQNMETIDRFCSALDIYLEMIYTNAAFRFFFIAFR